MKWARVRVGEELVGEIGPGLLTLLGVSKKDTRPEADWIIRKISKLRIFEDETGKMNRSLLDVGGGHLIVSQFTLYGDCQKGNRPSFIEAASSELACELYDYSVALSAQLGLSTASGRFQADMKVELLNDGPVTLWLESPQAMKGGSLEY